MRIINGKREEGKNFKAGFVSEMHRRRKCGIFCMEKLKTVSSQETLYIENVGANTKYKYIPYGGYYTEKDEIVSDSYVKGDAKKYDIQYCPLGAFGFAALENTKSPLENAYF